jgi:DNA-binding NarL/FixJ family response regulator
MSNPSSSVLIVDDHDLVGASLEFSLRSQGLAAHRCSTGDRATVLAVAARHPPGVALLDLDLGRDRSGARIDGVTLVEPLRSAGWRVLVLSGTADQARLGAALAAGALAAVPKQAPLATLLAAVRAALVGRDVTPPGYRERLIEAHRARAALMTRLDRLSTREREVLALLAAGHRAQAVADRFVVSLATVRTQIRAVLTKLGVSSQLEAVALYRDATERR